MAKSVVMFSLAIPAEIYELLKILSLDTNASITKLIIVFITEGIAKRRGA